MFDMLNAWYKEADKFKRGEIAKEEYDAWRYNFPRVKAERLMADLDARRSEKNSKTSK